MSNRKVSVESLIDEMYDALERATKLPLMSKSLVNVSELTSILDEINEKEGTISAVLNFPEMYDFRDKCTVFKDIKDNYKVIEL